VNFITKQVMVFMGRDLGVSFIDQKGQVIIPEDAKENLLSFKK